MNAVSDASRSADIVAAGLLIYDGDCGFCTQSARYVEARLQPGQRIAPWQQLDLDLFSLSESDVTTAAYWIEPDLTAHRGADGMIRAATQTSGVLRMAGRVLSVPPFRQVARLVYPVISKYRHKLPGATDACRLPS